MTKLLHIIDGSGYIFRAYYAIRALGTAKGESTNAVYGFTTMIDKALREEKPTHIAITFDTGGPTFRRELYDKYKANRSPPPEDLPPQIPRIHQITDAFQLKKLMVKGVEADDVIATLTRMALEDGFDVRIITADKDLMQLVSDRVHTYDPMKGSRFGPKEVEEKWGVPPNKLADVFALCGDSSDNIPGVKGVGPKTAVKLIQDYGTLDAALEAAVAGKVKGKMGQTLAAAVEDARISAKLVALKTDVEVGLTIDELEYHGPDKAKLKPLYIELEFRRLIPAVEDAVSEPADEETEEEDEGGPRFAARLIPPPPAEKIDRDQYRTISTAAELKALVAELKTAKRIGVALETTTARMADADPIGLAFSWGLVKGAYIPVGHVYLGCPKQLAFSEVMNALKPVLESREIAKVSTELKPFFAMFERYGITTQRLVFDSTIASYLLEPDELNHGSTLVARRWLHHEPLDRANAMLQDKAKLTFEQVPIDVATKLTAERAEIAWRATDAMKLALEEYDVANVLSDVELPLVPVLARMELAGIRIDVTQLGAMSVKFAEELVKLEKACYEAAGKEINIGSPKQLQKVLFEDLGLKIVKRTKTGPSTDASVLEILADSHPLPQAILDYRQVQKLKSTYVDALPKMVSPKTSRVHTVFSQTVAATGRLSSTDPNLQNIPIRSELGRQLRKVFVADPGNVLISVDYSQVELRVLAHFTQDAILMDAFTRGIDVHTRTAAALFQIEPSQVSREQRTQAKAVNFGVLYGMGPARLARDLKIPRKMASKFVEDYFERQPLVRKYIDDTLDFARKNGYVRTLLGRRRTVANINSTNGGARAAAERIATNTPIQGSAADLIKLAMIRLDARLAEEKLGAVQLLQVHDELLVEAKESNAKDVAALVKYEMEHVFPMKAPLLAEAHWGPTWDEAH